MKDNGTTCKKMTREKVNQLKKAFDNIKTKLFSAKHKESLAPGTRLSQKS